MTGQVPPLNHWIDSESPSGWHHTCDKKGCMAIGGATTPLPGHSQASGPGGEGAEGFVPVLVGCRQVVRMGVVANGDDAAEAVDPQRHVLAAGSPGAAAAAGTRVNTTRRSSSALSWPPCSAPSSPGNG